MNLYSSESEEDVEIYNKHKRKKILYVNVYEVDSSSDDNYFFSKGGAPPKVKVPKTFIDKIKRKPNIKINFKNYELEETKPITKGDIIMATIIEYNFLKKELKKDTLSNSDIKNYLLNGDYLPLIYGDTNPKNIILMKKFFDKKKKTYLRKKTNIFKSKDKPIVVYFKVNSNITFYKTKKKEKTDDNIVDVGDNAITQYLIGRLFFSIPNPKDNLTITSIEGITFDTDKYQLKTIKKDDYNYPFEKMSVENFENILKTIVDKCSKFV